MFPVSEERLSQRKAITDAEIQREAITKDAVFDVVRRNLTVVSRRNDVVLVEQLTRRANWNTAACVLAVGGALWHDCFPRGPRAIIKAAIGSSNVSANNDFTRPSRKDNRAICDINYWYRYSCRCSLPWRRTRITLTTTRRRRWSTSVCCSRWKVRLALRGPAQRRRWLSETPSNEDTSTTPTSGTVFTARRHASAVLAMGLCLSVRVCVCHKSVFYRNGWTNRAGFWHVSFLPTVLHCVKRKFGYLQKLGHFPLELCPKLRT